MGISIFHLFSIGIGPSSSHTVGPMRAAKRFVVTLKQQEKLQSTSRITIDLYGSLALTGKGHGTDKALLNGLSGFEPETIDPSSITPHTEAIIKNNTIQLLDNHLIAFSYLNDLVFHQKEVLPYHTNGMRFSAYNQQGETIETSIYYSIGGGFIVKEDEIDQPESQSSLTVNFPYPFDSAAELLKQCADNKMQIKDIMLENEKVWHSKQEIFDKILNITAVMQASIEAGCSTPGILPGILKVTRRAPALYEKLENNIGYPSLLEQADIMNWLNLYAIAVNEENAAGGRVVTAPTNGAAGIIPAVLAYYKNFHQKADDAGIINFMLTAAAIGTLYKKNASISGAEVGCQGEVGVAASMAAAGLTAAMGGSVEQIENAAEIAMEHHLGMTCDPIAGLVQIPCIERNAMGAVKAVNAARMSLISDGQHKVSLDKVIETMRQTGKDMLSRYKETSLGGLAVNVIEC